MKQLLDISQQLSFEDLTQQLRVIDAMNVQKDCPLSVPLVGEFSSGKTSLLNALTDCRALETATKPTTATIYELHFGAAEVKAIAYRENGEVFKTSEITSLKNEELSDALIVEVYDTSNRVPSSITLIDTPGLSSPDIRHRDSLVRFLPKADAILLVSDINQQITRSTEEFVETMSLAGRRIYLVFTKCDTKDAASVAVAKEYVGSNSKLAFSDIICTSASTESLDELYKLLNQLQQEKSEILSIVNAQRVKDVAVEMRSRISQLIESSTSDKACEEVLVAEEQRLYSLRRAIDTLLNMAKGEIEEATDSAYREFSSQIFLKLDEIVARSGGNHDASVQQVINSTSSLVMQRCLSAIQIALKQKVQQSKRLQAELPMSTIRELDLSQYGAVNGLSYNLSLNELGHQYDGFISGTAKVLAAVGAVGAVASGVGFGVVAAGRVATAVNTADTISDVASIASNYSLKKKLQKYGAKVNVLLERGKDVSGKISSLEELDTVAGEKIGSDKGLLGGIIFSITDKFLGKPQRQRAIREYVDESLLPDFKAELGKAQQRMLLAIGDALEAEATSRFIEMEQRISELKAERDKEKDTFQKRIAMLKEFNNELSKY